MLEFICGMVLGGIVSFVMMCIFFAAQESDGIARLRARIVRYQLKNTNQRNELARLNEQVAEQKAELDGKDVEIMRLKHEIERLSQPVFIMETKEMTEEEIKRLLNKPAMLTIKPSDKTRRNEAIKEFAERLKADSQKICDNIYLSCDFESYVDNLVQEMTEGE